MNPNILNKLETKSNDITGASLSLTFLYPDNIENQVNKDDVIESLSVGVLSLQGCGFLLIARTPMNNIIVHYEGFQIRIYENHPTWIEQRYASEVSLSSHPDFYIFDGNACTPDFGSCLIKSLRNCDDLVRDYGENNMFEPTWVFNPPSWNDPDNF